MDNRQSTVQRAGSGEMIQINTVLKNTYIMLALTLIFSAVTSAIAMHTNASSPNIFLFIVVAIGFPFLLQAVKNSPWAIVITFAYTGFIGWAIGPILNMYIKGFTNGPELIMLALGSTGLIFLMLSAIAMNPKRDFSRIGGFLAVGVIMAFIASLVNIFFLKLPMFQVAISVVFSLISGGYILYMTNQIIRGGERNYLIATVVLYVSLVNIFLTLLQLFSMFGGNRN